MRKIIDQWASFVNEGAARRYRFDTSIDIITDEVLEALKRAIGNSSGMPVRTEFRFANGESGTGRKLPSEISKFVQKIEGVVRLVDSIEDPNDSGVIGSYQESKKLMKLFVNVPATFEVQDIRPSDLVAKIKSTLRHEFEHTLDSLKGLERKAYGLGYGSLEEYYNYFTSPHEVNAYVVGFKKRSKLTGQPWAEIKDGFLSWLKENLLKKVNAEKSWDQMNLGMSGREKASVDDVEDFIQKVDMLMSAKHKERYGENQT